MRPELVAIDIGGTFIDFVALRTGSDMAVHKQLSRPGNLAEAVMDGLRIIGRDRVGAVVHGTTVATNALIQRSGADTALVTTAGFADVIEIGRQDRPGLYDLSPAPVEPLVPRSRRYEINERIDGSGNVLVEPSPEELHELARRIAADGVRSVAVCLLFSFRNSDHEERMAAALLEAGVEFVTTSNRVVPQFREYERTTTTVANAYVSPLLAEYLERVDETLTLTHQATFDVMQSSGGLLGASEAMHQGVRLLLSGPAAGVAGGFTLARGHDITRVITLDMGGTSTDVALCDGFIPSTSESVLAGVPIRIPMVAVETVGAGGGSIARVDSGGGLRVGPESVGSDPGPACFGRGVTASVTDAQAVCGLLDPSTFLGGRLDIDLTRARDAISRVAAGLNLTIEAAAEGILQVAEASMEGAIRRISVERGHDPRDFVLCAFGGAGPLHACALADALSIPRILVPLYPGVTSALGMAMADMTREYSMTVLGLSSDELAGAWADLEAQAVDALPDARRERTVECRYTGQGYELEIPADPVETLSDRFGEAHNRRFGYADFGRSIQVVTARVTARKTRDIPAVNPWLPTSPRPARVSQAILAGQSASVRVVERLTLAVGSLEEGPAILVQPDSAILVRAGWVASVCPDGCIMMERC